VDERGECRRSLLVAFSCRGRSFCPSCEKKKQLPWAEWLREGVLLGVAHRHVVLTIPRLLRRCSAASGSCSASSRAPAPRRSRSSSATRATKATRGPGSWSRSPPNPLSLEKLVYLDGRQAVFYRSRMNPALAVASRRWTRSNG
jgi:hypothetical protein